MKKNWPRLQTQKKVSGKFWVLCAPYLVTDKSWSASQSIESHTTCRAHTSRRSSMQLLYLQLQNLSSQKKKKQPNQEKHDGHKGTNTPDCTYIHRLSHWHCFLFPSLPSLAPHKANTQLSSQICQIRIKMGVLQIFCADLMTSCSLQKVFVFGNNKLWMLVTCPKKRKENPPLFLNRNFALLTKCRRVECLHEEVLCNILGTSFMDKWKSASLP